MRKGAPPQGCASETSADRRADGRRAPLRRVRRSDAKPPRDPPRAAGADPGRRERLPARPRAGRFHGVVRCRGARRAPLHRLRPLRCRDRRSAPARGEHRRTHDQLHLRQRLRPRAAAGGVRHHRRREDRRREPHRRDRRRLRQPVPRKRSRRLPRRVRAARVHDRERLLQESRRNRHLEAARGATRHGAKRPRSTSTWSRRTVRSARSSSSKRTRPRRSISPRASTPP